MNMLKKSIREMKRYPSAIVGLAVVFLLIAVAAYAMISIPYAEAIRLWRGGEAIWYHNPKNAPPAWFNLFSKKKAPETVYFNSADGTADKVVTVKEDGTSDITITYTFDFTADTFPQELFLYYNNKYDQKQPFVSLKWQTPDGREIKIGDFGVDKKQTYRFSQDQKLITKMGNKPPQESLFMNVQITNERVPLKGTYKLIISGTTFEQNSDINAELVVQGRVSGLAGTDHQRRNLMIPLLWGTPIALAFGLVASLGTSLLTMIIAAIGTWYGGWVDELIQRITEVNIILPFLSILIMVGTFYSRSIWVILGVTILLNIFTGGIKSYRAIFLQVKESTYIEAARAYGASNGRIIFVYLIPRMIPLLIPGLVSSIPSFVFLEASLAVLGLGDPVLPTWGKIIYDAQVENALYKGYYYWILEPAVLLMLTGLGFAMLGFALDRIFNPRLRGM
jgi:peptide/nickel transport system permease protein